MVCGSNPTAPLSISWLCFFGYLCRYLCVVDYEGRIGLQAFYTFPLGSHVQGHLGGDGPKWGVETHPPWNQGPQGKKRNWMSFRLISLIPICTCMFAFVKLGSYFIFFFALHKTLRMFLEVTNIPEKRIF